MKGPDVNEQHKESMTQFFRANLAGREQEPGAGFAWLVEFWLRTPAEQRKEISTWVGAQKAAVQASADRHVAQLDALASEVNPNGNGNRATRRAAARAKPTKKAAGARR